MKHGVGSSEVPVWSPTGEWILFSNDLYSPDGQNTRSLGKHGSPNYACSTDGKASKRPEKSWYEHMVSALTLPPCLSRKEWAVSPSNKTPHRPSNQFLGECVCTVPEGVQGAVFKWPIPCARSGGPKSGLARQNSSCLVAQRFTDNWREQPSHPVISHAVPISCAGGKVLPGCFAFTEASGRE